jgi:hypothetical protein
MKIRHIVWMFLAGLLGAAIPARAQGTSAFTYHGQLGDSGQPARGTYDLTFSLYDSAINGNIVGSVWTNAATTITNGLFNVIVDFGGGAFSGPARWLELGVRTNGGLAFAPLAPRQALTPIPYALSASNLTGTLPATQLSGTLPTNLMPLAVSTLTVSTLNVGSLSSASIAASTATITNLYGGGQFLTGLPVHSMVQAAPVPPLAYVTWWDMNTNLTESAILALAQRWQTNGMLAAGFNIVWLDDGWMLPNRDTNNNLVADPAKFPDGMAYLAGRLHSLGFKAGIYTCAADTGFLGYQDTPDQFALQHMQQFASWGFDAVTVDAQPGQSAQAQKSEILRVFPDAIQQAWSGYNNFPITRFGLNPTPPFETPFECNVFFDGSPPYEIYPLSNCVLQVQYGQATSLWTTRPGCYQEINSWWQVGAAQTNDYLGAMTMHAIKPSYVLCSDVTAQNIFIFTNREVLNVLQDPAVIPGSPVYTNGQTQVWMRPLGGTYSGSNAIALVNLSSAAAAVPVSFANFAWYSGQSVTIRDCWNHMTLGTFTGGWTNTIPANSALLYVAEAAQGTTGAYKLSDNGTNRTFYFNNGVLINVTTP